MRYDKPEMILRLALFMQGSAEGLRLADIQSAFAVSRRTAERMRDAVIRLFPQVEELSDGGRQKRWRLPSGLRPALLAPTLEELSALDAAAKLLEQASLKTQGEAVATLGQKLRAALAPAVRRRLDPDLDALSQAEAVTHRPGPYVPIDGTTLAIFREAILAGRWIEARYRSRITGVESVKRLAPLGFLYGPRPFLLAQNPEWDRPQHYALDRFSEVRLLPDPAPVLDIDLAAFVQRSFGVFQDAEGPRQIVWRFTAHAAPNARTYRFHPTQEMIDLPEGGLEVRFTASSLWEMALHLFGWGPDVEVIEPPELREELLFRCREVMSVYEDAPANIPTPARW